MSRSARAAASASRRVRRAGVDAWSPARVGAFVPLAEVRRRHDVSDAATLEAERVEWRWSAA